MYSGGRRRRVQRGGPDGVHPAELAAVDRRLARGDSRVEAARVADLHRHRRALEAAEQLGALRAVDPTGFSQSVGMPASTQARISFVWASVAAAMMTPSTPEPSRASSESTPSTPWPPNRSTTVLVFAGTMSVTTSESIAGIPTRVLAWNAPIRPSPMSPRRMSVAFLVAEGSAGSRSCGDARGVHPVRVGHGGRLPAGQHVEDALGGGGEGRRRPAPAQPHQVRGETTSGWSNSGWCAGRLGVEHVQPDPAEPAVLQRRVAPRRCRCSPPRPQLTRTAPGLTAPSSSASTRWWVSEQRQVQGDHVAAATRSSRSRARAPRRAAR